MRNKIKMKSDFFALLIVLFFSSCNSENEIRTNEDYLLVDSVSTDALIPKSYVFSSIPQQVKDHVYYIDKSIGGVIKVDKQFENAQKILSEGQDFMSIPKILYFSIANHYLFAFGNNQCLVYDLKENNFVSKYDFPFKLAQQIVFDEDKKKYLTVSVDENNQSNIVLFDFREHKGFLNTRKVAKIRGDNKLHYMEYSGWLTIIDNSVFYVKDWVGEVDEFSRNDFGYIRQFQLPHSGILEDNKNFGGNGQYTSNYFQAYSVIQHDDNIYILREIDWESELIGEKSMDNPEFIKKIRNRVHVFNKDFELTESFRLSRPATFINFIGDKLYTLNYEDESLYIYQDSN